MALFAVAVCALLVAGTLTVVGLGEATPEPCCPGGMAADRPSPAPRTTSARANGLPACLIGSWRTVDESFLDTFYTNENAIPFTGAGRMFELHADGTGVERHDNVVFSATFQGNQLRIVANGDYTFTWTANDKAITYLTTAAGTLAYSFYDQFGLRTTQAHPANPALNEVDEYACTPTTLTETNSALGYRSVWVRTTGFGVYG